jgi:hypothetical protein
MNMKSQDWFFPQQGIKKPGVQPEVWHHSETKKLLSARVFTVFSPHIMPTTWGAVNCNGRASEFRFRACRSFGDLFKVPPYCSTDPYTIAVALSCLPPAAAHLQSEVRHFDLHDLVPPVVFRR